MNPDINTVDRRVAEIKQHLDKAWEKADELLAELYGDEGEAPEYERLYAMLTQAYEDYLVRASRMVDDAVWEVHKISKR